MNPLKRALQLRAWNRGCTSEVCLHLKPEERPTRRTPPPYRTGAFQAPAPAILPLLTSTFSLFAVDNLLLRKLRGMTVLAGSENKPLIGFSCVPFCSLTSEQNPLISPGFNVRECSVISVFKDRRRQSDPQSVVAAAARLCGSRDRSCRWIQALQVLKDVPTGPGTGALPRSLDANVKSGTHRRLGTHLNAAGAAVLRELVNQRSNNVRTPERSSHVVFVRELMIHLVSAQQVHFLTSAVAAPSEDLLLPLI